MQILIYSKATAIKHQKRATFPPNLFIHERVIAAQTAPTSIIVSSETVQNLFLSHVFIIHGQAPSTYRMFSLNNRS